MIEAAGDAGFGAVRDLQAVFTNFRKWGLLGPDLKKRSQRGGMGRWHDSQARLWLPPLHHRYGPNPVRVGTLLNIPVAL